MLTFLKGFGVAFLAGGLLLGGVLFYSKFLGEDADPAAKMADIFQAATERKKTPEELHNDALKKSKNIKGLYMTADVAWDTGAGAKRLRENLVRIAEETEINGLVIDVKEACGEDYDAERVKEFLKELREKDIWAIARIVVMSDASHIYTNPEWYITRKSKIRTGSSCVNKKHLQLKPDSNQPSITNNQLPITSNVVFWQDKAGRYWVDPASPGGREYILEFSKKMIDLGFDELQYDYIRFPSDGDVKNAIFSVWDRKTSMCAVMRDYFRFLSTGLREYKPDIILSADFFGYASIGLDTGIGQCLEALEDNFDYVSFMVYPSHYYSGFKMPADPYRKLPILNYTMAQSRANPQDIVGRSMQFARDFFDGKISTSTYPFSYIVACLTPSVAQNCATLGVETKTRLRPWLEDFFHEEDCVAQRPCNAAKVRLQIDAAENSDNHGWMLWNAANVYTESALKKE